MAYLAFVLMALAIWFLRRAQADPTMLSGPGRTWQWLARALLALVVAQALFALAMLGWQLATHPDIQTWTPMLLFTQLPGLLISGVAGWALWQDLRFQGRGGPQPRPGAPARPLTRLWRGLVVVTLVVLMAGFGLCGSWGVMEGIIILQSGGDAAGLAIGLGSVGLLIAGALARQLFKNSPAEDR